MFSAEDFKIESMADLASFLVVLPFVGLVAPFLIAAYTLGFVQDITGWLDT
jgi:hypothetical protein